MVPPLEFSLSTTRVAVLLAKYTLCSAASTEKLLTTGINENEACQTCEPAESSLLTTAAYVLGIKNTEIYKF